MKTQIYLIKLLLFRLIGLFSFQSKLAHTNEIKYTSLNYYVYYIDVILLFLTKLGEKTNSLFE